MVVGTTVGVLVNVFVGSWVEAVVGVAVVVAITVGVLVDVFVGGWVSAVVDVGVAAGAVEMVAV